MVGYTLDVTVYRGRDLVPTNKQAGNEGEVPSTFCTIKYSKWTWSTLTADKTLNPVWDTIATFDDVEATNPKTGKIRFKVFEEGEKKKEIGETTLSLASLDDTPVFEKWLSLTDKSGKEKNKGEVKVKLVYHSPRYELFRKGTLATIEPAASTSNVLTVTPSSTALEKTSVKELVTPSIEKQKAASKNVTFKEHPETQQLLDQAEEVRKDTLKSTTKTLETLESTVGIATDTMTKLESQGQQLNRINGELDTIDAYTDETRRKIRGIKSIFGAAANAFTKNKNKSKLKEKSSIVEGKKEKLAKKKKEKSEERRAIEKRNKYWRKDGPNEADPNGENEGGQHDEVVEGRDELLEGRDKPKTSVKIEEVTGTDVQIDEHLDLIAKHVQNLKMMACNVGEEVARQTETISEIQDRAEKDDDKITRQTYQISKRRK